MKIMVPGVDTPVNNVVAAPKIESAVSENVTKDPVPKKEAMKTELTRWLLDKIITCTSVTEPTDWVSSVLAVPKKDGSVRICLDPKDLNTAIKHSHYPLPTVEDVTSPLTNAKVFSVLDAKSGFWQVKLTENSSYLTTLTPPLAVSVG